MDDATRQDIRAVLKTFGIKADQALTAYLQDHPQGTPISVHIRLTATTDDDSGEPSPAFEVTVEGEIRR